MVVSQREVLKMQATVIVGTMTNDAEIIAAPNLFK